MMKTHKVTKVIGSNDPDSIKGSALHFISMKTLDKMVVMDRERLKQLRDESDAWKRALQFMQTENSHLKTRIADIVTQDISNEMLAEAENFQNRFITKDELIALARKDIRDFDTWLALTPADNNFLCEALQKQKKLRTELETLEQRFNKLKFEFHQYIAENF